jgi:ribosomal-protein-alanine N-acetyltransferase
MLALKRDSTLKIKPVGPFDLGRLARLHQACFEDPWSRADLAHLLALPGGFGLLARLFEPNLAGLDGMRGVGFALCRVVRDEGELLSIGVGPAYRRRAIGAALLRESMDRCRRAGAVAMFLEVATDNVTAQMLYQAFGFDEVGKRDGYYQRANGTRVSAYTMRCDLATLPLPPDGHARPWR